MLEDMIDTFWENPSRSPCSCTTGTASPVIDMFAGRELQRRSRVATATRPCAAIRKLLKRERDYDDEGLFSVPIGSRFHAERRALVDSQLDSVETTEALDARRRLSDVRAAHLRPRRQHDWRTERGRVEDDRMPVVPLDPTTAHE